jgi:hypothetical protein
MLAPALAGCGGIEPETTAATTPEATTEAAATEATTTEATTEAEAAATEEIAKQPVSTAATERKYDSPLAALSVFSDQAETFDMTLYLSDGAAWATYPAKAEDVFTILQRAVADLSWEAAEREPDGEVEFRIELSLGAGRKLTVWCTGSDWSSRGSEVLGYDAGGDVSYWVPRSQDLPGAALYFVSAGLRDHYDMLELSAKNVPFGQGLSAEEAAERFAEEILGSKRLGLAPGSSRAASGYRAVHWNIAKVRDDGGAVEVGVTYALFPAESYWCAPFVPGVPVILWAGAGRPGEGEYEGAVVSGMGFLLERQEDGSWLNTAGGTGEIELP